MKIENRSHKLSHVISSTESESEDSERFHFFRFRLRLHRLWSSENYPKIPKINPRFFKGPFQGAYIRRGLSTEGNLRFQIAWVRLIFRSKFTVFALVFFVFEGNFPSTRSWLAYIFWGEQINRGFFLRYRFGGWYVESLIFGILRYIVGVGSRSGRTNQSQGPETNIVIGLFFRFWFGLRLPRS